MADTSWADSLPEVVDHPAAGAVAAPQTAAPDTSWAGGMPEVIDHPAAIPEVHVHASAAHPVAAPTGSLLTDIPRVAGTMGTDLLGGALGLPSAAASGIDWLGKQVGANLGTQQALAGIKAPGTNQPLFPDPEAAREMAYQTTGATEFQPQSLMGRAALAGGEMATGGIGSGLKTLATSLPALFAGGAAGQMAAEAVPEHPFIARLLGSIGGAGLGRIAMQAPSQLGGAVAGNATNPVYQAYQRLGIPTALGGDVTGNPTLQFAQAFASKMPGAEGRIAEAQANAVGSWQTALQKTADKLSPAETAEEAGGPIQTAAQNWLSDWKSDIGQKWGAFRFFVPKNQQIAVPNFQNALDGVRQDFGGADNLAKALQPQLANTLNNALGADLKGGNTLPWQSVQAVRTRLGEMLENAQPVEGMALSAVKRLYGGLTDDMAAGAAAVSPQASMAFRVANAATAAGHGLLDDHIRGILNAPTPEQATQVAMQRSRLGGSRLEALGQAAPDMMGPLGSYVLHNAAPGESPTAFASNIAGAGIKRPTLSPEAFNALFPNPATQQAIQDLSTVGQSMKATEAAMNHSGTAVHQGRGLGRIMAAREMGEMGHEMGGPLGRVAGMALGAMSPEIFGKAAGAVALNPALARLYASSPLVQFSRAPWAARLPLLSQPALPFSLSGPATSPTPGQP